VRVTAEEGKEKPRSRTRLPALCHTWWLCSKYHTPPVREVQRRHSVNSAALTRLQGADPQETDNRRAPGATAGTLREPSVPSLPAVRRHQFYLLRVPRSNPTALPFSLITMQLHIKNNPAPCRLSGNYSATGQTSYGLRGVNTPAALPEPPPGC